MTIKEKINTDFMVAYKAKDMLKKNFLGVLKGAIQTQEGKMIESTDENVLKVIKSMEKGVTESIEGRKLMDLDITEQLCELTYIRTYQPPMMSEDEIRVIVKEIIVNTTNKNLGYIMGVFNKEKRDKSFDNKIVSNIIKEELV